MNSWVSPLISKCHKQGTLNFTDLYEPLPSCQSITLTDKLESSWFDETKQNPEKPSLIRATLRTMGWRPLLISFLLLPSVSINVLIDNFYLLLIFHRLF